MKRVIGKVISGNKKGGDLGFPTANVKLQEKMESGVFSGIVFYEKNSYKAALFIGHTGEILEAHILDFSGDLYDKEIEVEIGEKIREVQKFSSTEELISQIRNDVEIIKKK